MKSLQNRLKNHPNAVRLSVIFFAMVLVGVVCRLELTGIPNVKPIAAMVLWAAFALRSWRLPALALLTVMVVSDCFLGGYAWPIAVSVYGSLLVSCGLGVWVRGRIEHSGKSLQPTNAGGQMIVASLVMSTAFFLLTNAAVWAAGWYAPTLGGLVSCYAAAIPFYRFTLVGDLAFTMGGLVVWQVVVAMQQSRQKSQLSPDRRVIPRFSVCNAGSCRLPGGCLGEPALGKCRVLVVAKRVGSLCGFHSKEAIQRTPLLCWSTKTPGAKTANSPRKATGN